MIGRKGRLPAGTRTSIGIHVPVLAFVAAQVPRTDRRAFNTSDGAALRPKLACHPVCQSRSAMPPGVRSDAGSSTGRAAARP